MGVPSTWKILNSSSISCRAHGGRGSGAAAVRTCNVARLQLTNLRACPARHAMGSRVVLRQYMFTVRLALLQAGAGGSAHRVAGEEGLLVDHLSKDAADAPQVHGRGVVLHAQQDLGRAVPQRDHLCRREKKGRRESEFGLGPASRAHRAHTHPAWRAWQVLGTTVLGARAGARPLQDGQHPLHATATLVGRARPRPRPGACPPAASGWRSTARTSCVYCRTGMPKARASPKSASLSVLVARSISRFCGLRSRCSILASATWERAGTRCA